MFNKISRSFTYGQHTVTLETGYMARQASGAIMARMGDTVVMVTAVGKAGSGDARGFFPLTINYQERSYAAGRIPANFFRREGRPSEQETLLSRLIDRPIRPLFPKGFQQEVQIIATLVSLDPDVSPEVPALIGASAALAISGLPFQGPIAAAKVGHIDGELILNPSKSQLKQSRLDLVVAGTNNAVLMVESQADLLPENTMLDAVSFGHQHMQVAIEAINDMANEVKASAMDWAPASTPAGLEARVQQTAEQALGTAWRIRDKGERNTQLSALRKTLMAEILALYGDADAPTESEVSSCIQALEKTLVRSRVLDSGERIDGRDLHTVRPIHIQTGILPRAHGSVVFTRGETQALVVATLGSDRDAQLIDSLEEGYKDRFMLHYNFPPSCVGECGFMGSPKRREIGHGRLARRGIHAVLPKPDSFPYVLRVVSEITESNGSSSMASVCGASLALMDAGVPLKTPVAGIAMGLIKEGDRFAVLTDILGDEDHLGDMDFKVAGSADGVSALQMDIKIDGITTEIMAQALEQARAGRLHILGEMNQVLDRPREQVSAFAPQITSMTVPADKIRTIIGKGGATIRALTEETGATIDISDDGVVTIAARDQACGDEARRRIEELTADVEVGKVYEGTVCKIMDFGAFVTVLPGKDGLVHISQISHERVEKVSDKLSEGEIIRVKVLEVDRQGRIRLSMKALLDE